MFQSARLKLTLYYTIILLSICIIFSLAFYQTSMSELRRGLHLQTFHYIPFSPPTSPIRPSETIDDRFLRPTNSFPLPRTETSIFEEVQQRIIFRLVISNTLILLLAGIASYFLAGKTLAPIEIMLDEQKRFVADASHDLRTPLTVMKTQNEVALRDTHLKLAQAKELLQSNLEEVGKLEILSNYLLRLEYYTSEKNSLSFETINLKSLVSHAVSMIETLAEDKDIHIHITGEDLDIRGNYSSLSDLIVILLDNAIKYSPEHATVEMRTQKAGKYVSIEVEDQGRGIKASDLPYIFNRFYRADTARTKSHVDGYGLGLSIAKGIVKKHNGKIKVESELEQGTCFTILLPYS